MLARQYKTLIGLFVCSKRRIRQKSCGFSIIEMMVGMTIGLFLLTGVSRFFIDNINNARHILLQARIDQNLRNIMDLVIRDLRRSGYWQHALNGTSTVSVTANPYTDITLTLKTGNSHLSYAYGDPLAISDSLVASRVFGFRLNTVNNSLEMNIGGNFSNWQSLTDTSTVKIIEFIVVPTLSTIDIGTACAKKCIGVACPTITVRTYNVVLTGLATRNPAINRTLRSQVLVRNNLLAGTCIQ